MIGNHRCVPAPGACRRPVSLPLAQRVRVGSDALQS